MESKRILFAAALVAGAAFAPAQIVFGQADNFPGGEVHGWVGSPEPYGPMNIANGGPLGTGDAYCQVDSIGGFGPGSRLAMYNQNQWSGNWSLEGVRVVRADMKVLAGGSLLVRPVIFGLEGTRYTSTNAYSASLANDGAWHRVNFFLTQPGLTQVIGTETYAEVIGGVTQFMIRHQTGAPSANGTAVVGTWGIDNITATDTAEFEPTAVAVIEGEAFLGDLSSLSYSDDNRYSILSDGATLNGIIEFSANTPLLAPAAIGARVEQNASRLGLAVNLSLFRFSTNSFQVIGGATATGNDTSVQGTLTSNTGNYTSGTGQMRARVTWSPINDEDPAFDGWELAVDEFAFRVKP